MTATPSAAARFSSSSRDGPIHSNGPTYFGNILSKSLPSARGFGNSLGGSFTAIYRDLPDPQSF